MIGAGLGCLNGPAGEAADTAAPGGILRSLAVTGAKHPAAWMRFLRRFGASGGHDAGGHATSSAWLAGQRKIAPRAARGPVGRMRKITARPPVAGALAGGAVSGSRAGEIAAWASRLPAEMRAGTGKILPAPAAAGAGYGGLALLADAAREKRKSQRPDPDEPDEGFGDRHLHLGTTLDGAGRITGNLTPECTAAVQAVLEALGKRRGKEDARTAAQRWHDALQEGCELLIRAKMVPDRTGPGPAPGWSRWWRCRGCGTCPVPRRWRKPG